jgi:hypothetical protein
VVLRGENLAILGFEVAKNPRIAKKKSPKSLILLSNE